MIQKAEERQTFWKIKKDRREAELVRLNRQLRELIRMRAENLITDRDFLAQKPVLSERRLALESTPVPDRINGERVREQLSEITKPLTHLPDSWQALPAPFQRRFGRLILPVGFVNEEVRTAELGLLFRVFGELTHDKANGVSVVSKFWNRIWQEIQDLAGLIRESRAAAKASEEAVLRNSGE